LIIVFVPDAARQYGAELWLILYINQRLLRRNREDALTEDDLQQELARASDDAELASALPALFSLAYDPKHSLANASVLAEQTWRDLAREPQYQHWPSQPPADYGFGHSLGGLLSLSLPALIGPVAAIPWEPQVILVCDPATMYYDDDLFRSFGGVKYCPNAYNTAWIWPALTALFQHRVPPAECLH
jgi:hypothetical protein